MSALTSPADEFPEDLEPLSGEAVPARRRLPGLTGSLTGVVVRTRRLGRRHIAAVAAILLTVWIVLAFARSASQASQTNDLAAVVRAENAAHQARLDATRRELQLAQTDAFLRFQARAYGIGEVGERPFTLAKGAAPAPRIVPLGGEPAPAPPRDPLADWLAFLFDA